MSSLNTQPYEKTMWCPFYELNNGDKHTSSWSTVEPGSVSAEQRDRNPDSALPPSPPNAVIISITEESPITEEPPIPPAVSLTVE